MLKVKDHLTGHILQALSTDEKVPDILGWLKHGETYQSIVEWLGRAPVDEFETLSPRESRHSAFEGSDHEMSGVSSTSRWTSVTSDAAVQAVLCMGSSSTYVIQRGSFRRQL